MSEEDEPLTREEQAFFDAYNLVGWRVVTLRINDRIAVYLAPPGDKPLEDLTFSEMRRCPWLEVTIEMQELGVI